MHFGSIIKVNCYYFHFDGQGFLPCILNLDLLVLHQILLTERILIPNY